MKPDSSDKLVKLSDKKTQTQTSELHEYFTESKSGRLDEF